MESLKREAELPASIISDLSYNPETGILFYRGEALNSQSNGYYTCYLADNVHLVHRLIYFIITGAPAPNDIDHINGNKKDNRFINLRPASRKQNCWNKPAHKDKSSSKYKGIYRNGNGFIARIVCNGERFNLGTYPTEEEAAEAYNTKARELFGEFAWLNEIT